MSDGMPKSTPVAMPLAYARVYPEPGYLAKSVIHIICILYNFMFSNLSDLLVNP